MATVTKEIVSYEDLDELIQEGVRYQEQLKDLLKDVKVPVTDPNVLKAIRDIFGPEYISSDGKAFITFDMVIKCMDITRLTGKSVSDEFIGGV